MGAYLVGRHGSKWNIHDLGHRDDHRGVVSPSSMAGNK